MADNKKTDKHLTPPTNQHDDSATVLSSTELKQTEETEQPSKARPASAIGATEATVFSATEVENLKTQAKIEDNDATQVLDDSPSLLLDDATLALDNEQATVLAGGTKAIHQAINTHFSPNVSVGSVIKDRFTLEKLLGRGGMGEVYLATDKRKLEAQDKNPYVALKVLGENFKRHPQAFVALQREARKTQELAHPNIVTVYDFDRQGDTVYLTMEALTGKPMDEEIRADVRPIEQACDMIRQCAQGLAYAHQKGLVHSDLKPGNLFLTEEGNVKLLDFGIARAFKSGKELDKQKQNSKNDTIFDAGELGALTPAYATCEMLEGQEPHPSDDVYALGLIAYELLTGKHPFAKQMATKAEEQALKPERVKGLSRQQWQAMENALAFRRENRTQNAQAFLDQFSAKSKTPLYIAASIILLAFIAVGSINFFIAPKIGPAIPFTELPIETQQKITSLREEALLANKFNDYNSALLQLNEAFLLHPYNVEVMKQLDLLVKDLLPIIDQKDTATKIKQVNALLDYEALKDNKQLINYRKNLH